jgi:hypothetical protein
MLEEFLQNAEKLIGIKALKKYVNEGRIRA